MLLFHYNIVIKLLLIHIFRTFTCKPFQIQDKTLIVNFCFPTVYHGHSVINRYSEWKETKRVKFLHIPKEQSTTAYNKEAYLWRDRKIQSLAWFLENQSTEWCWDQTTYPQTVDLMVSMNASPQPLPPPTLPALQDNHGL